MDRRDKTEKNTIAGADSDAQYICVLPCGGADQDPCPLPGNRYTEVGKGGCRGNGGTNDLVNSRSVKDSSRWRARRSATPTRTVWATR